MTVHSCVASADVDAIENPSPDHHLPAVVDGGDHTLQPIHASAFESSEDSQVWPIQNGHVANWKALQALWRTIVAKHCGIRRSTNQHALLLTIPVTWSRSDQEIATQILFEYINAPAVYLIDQPLAAIYGAGVTSGLVIDIGHTTTDITPVIDNVVLQSAAVSLPLGGQDIEAHLIQLMRADPEFLAEYGPLIGHQLARALKESAIFIATPIASAADSLAPATFSFDGQDIRVAAWRGRAIDVLFEPSIIGKDAMGLAHAIHTVIGNIAEPEKRIMLWENALLTGGCSQIKGIKDRIEKEIEPYVAASDTAGEFQPKEIKWIRLPDYFIEFKDRPADASFLGGVVTAKVVFTSGGGTFISKADYNEFGPMAPFLKSAATNTV